MLPPQTAELCEAANKEVPADQAVRIANYLCNGNYAVSGGLQGCEAVERLAKSFKARRVFGLQRECAGVVVGGGGELAARSAFLAWG